MNTKRKKLDVDFIGGMRPLTIEEEKRVIAAIKLLQQNLKEKKSASKQSGQKIEARRKSKN